MNHQKFKGGYFPTLPDLLKVFNVCFIEYKPDAYLSYNVLDGHTQLTSSKLPVRFPPVIAHMLGIS